MLIVEEADLGALDGVFEFCKKAGYWMEIEEPVRQLEKIEFCQTHPVRTSAGWVMVRNYPASIGKDMVSVLPLNTKVAWGRWAHDVGRCGVAINAGVPVVEEVYRAIARAGVGTFGDHPWTRGSGLSRLAEGLHGRTAHIDEDARVSFWEAFGITPDEQIELERFYSRYEFDLTPADVGKQHEQRLSLRHTSHDFGNTLTQPHHLLYNILLDSTQG